MKDNFLVCQSVAVNGPYFYNFQTKTFNFIFLQWAVAPPQRTFWMKFPSFAASHLGIGIGWTQRETMEDTFNFLLWVQLNCSRMNPYVHTHLIP